MTFSATCSTASLRRAALADQQQRRGALLEQRGDRLRQLRESTGIARSTARRALADRPHRLPRAWLPAGSQERLEGRDDGQRLAHVDRCNGTPRCRRPEHRRLRGAVRGQAAAARRRRFCRGAEALVGIREPPALCRRPSGPLELRLVSAMIVPAAGGSSSPGQEQGQRDERRVDDRQRHRGGDLRGARGGGCSPRSRSVTRGRCAGPRQLAVPDVDGEHPLAPRAAGRR